LLHCSPEFQSGKRVAVRRRERRRRWC
jgi:hypothetical protein